MGMFDNIVFDEFTLLEGQQAEEYKAKKKAKEKEEFKAASEKADRRINAGSRNRKGIDNSFDDIERNAKANLMAVKDEKKKKDLSYTNHSIRKDAANRHIRRHPNQYKEVAQIIASYESEFAY